ncbi:hypothetical protein JWG45_18280 [Leptospira sp. 201903070]|uniref:Hydrolase, carbon-nitrogen family n=1 Tax=Leptospira ainlahdjerensis TaxID=2810033 RepID=A0ABS2UHQ0_9LEPT|nr:hypothetical protein [Leptospira ainlahdjerensis]MBM9579098.1 hypothetical protein [Leptospira ainlahdjerensis]
MTPFWKNTIASLILIPIFLGIAFIFSGKEISSEQYAALKRKEYQILTAGYDRNAGNILVIQPEWRLEDFSSEERFLKSFENPIKQAKQKGLIKKNTLVVLPSHTGSFLYFLNARREVFSAPNLERAFFLLSLEIRFKNWIGLITGQKTDPYSKISSTYQRIFSNLSRTYGIYLLPGSILLPGARLEDGNLTSNSEGEWKEFAFLFEPDGKIAKEFLSHNPSEIWKKDLSKFTENNFSSLEEDDRSLITFQFPFARFGIFYLEEFKNPEFQDKIKKTFVSRIIAIGEESSETFLKEWATKSNFESTIRVIPSGSLIDQEYEGGSYVKTRYGAPTPGVNSREPLILNLFL